VGVGVDPALALEAPALHRPGLLDPATDSRAALVSPLADESTVRHRGDLEVDVDPVE
jgi:hypothetical protein